jgi:hypothetical protein
VVYVWQDTRKIEIRERAADGSWRVQVVEAGEVGSIESLDCRVEVDALYGAAGGP